MLISLDALGTLVELEPPAPLLAEQLRARGVELTVEQAGSAIAAEIGYYRSHLGEGTDAEAVQHLRDRCAGVLGEALAQAGVQAALCPAQLRAALLAALRFRPYPEVTEALRALRAAGHRLVVVSNWDASLHEMLRDTGLDALLDGAISSAQVGRSKPDPAIFRHALELVGDPDGADALHAGDSIEYDVFGALAAGMQAALVVRDGSAPVVPAGVAVVSSLAQLATLAP